jgi:hypothetical protein
METDIIREKICNKMFGIPRFGENGIVVLQLRKDGRRGKTCLAVKHCQWMLLMDKKELVRVKYERQ